ncbi:hypothetical protein [uncultured Nostoc sp.]|uniref:hypothetical protein n=1 Tax=uncultured Nostoc sp. TaxID=340711 RepID=UPI0035CC8D5C
MSTSGISKVTLTNISPTTLLVAYVWQFSNIAYAREIAELTHAKGIARQFERMFEKSS